MVILAIVAIAAVGLYSMLTIPVDALPDLSDVQVIIMAEYSGQSPQIIEDQVVYPLTSTLLSVPNVKDVRGESFFNFGMVYLIFEDGTDIYWARSRVLEYLNSAQDRLPQGVMTRIGPDATGLGWVYQWVLKSKTQNLAELRSLEDWFIRYEVQGVPGVAEVASVGGFVKQYQVVMDPDKMANLGVTVADLRQALEESNRDVGGRTLEMAETEFLIRSRGYIEGENDAERVEQIERIPLRLNANGLPVLLKQVAQVQVGPELRRGIAEWNGEGEIVGGIAVIRYGENALAVIERVKAKLADLRKSLPPGVEIVESYDRSALIHRSIDTLTDEIISQIIIVSLVIFIFLFHFRSSLVAILTLPVGILMSFIIMRWAGINANIMSLGGIIVAIGVMVDAAVVMVENAHKRLERHRDEQSHLDIIILAAREVGPAMFWGLMITMISFLPILFLQSQEGRLFIPLAYTKSLAMLAAAFLAITLIPALMVFFVRGKLPKEEKNPVNRFFMAIYDPVLQWALWRPWIIIAAAGVVLLVTLYPWSKIGSEFMPALNEGDLLYMPTTAPSISTTKAKELLQQTDRIIKSFPEVESVFGKIGRAETVTDPAPLSMIETTIILKHDPKEWRQGVTKDSLVRALDAAIQIPGLTNAWTMPIRTRIDMLSTGIKTPIGIKILGDNLDTLSALGEHVEAITKKLPGVSSAFAERTTGGKYLDIEIDRDRAARYGLRVGQIQDVISSALGGVNVTTTIEGSARYPVNLRYPADLRDDLSSIERIRIPVAVGMQAPASAGMEMGDAAAAQATGASLATVPLGAVATIRVTDGPPMIKTEDGRKTVWVYVDTRENDVGTLVDQLQKAVNKHIVLPSGYSLIWSGQFEYIERVRQRMLLIVPLTLLIIFFFLYLQFRTFSQSLLLMIPLPFALVGGIWLMYILNYDMSVAVVVGMIAMAGVAAETGIVMEVYLAESVERYRSEGRLNHIEDLREAIREGAVQRLRPKLMTVATDIIGLLPAMTATGTGSEVMKRIAAPLVGGLVTSTLHVLILIPAIYFLLKRPLVSGPRLPEP